MQGLVNYARGWVRLVACGPFPERLLNLCAQRGMTFWAVEWLDGQTLRLTLLRRDMGGLEELALRAGCTVEIEQRVGLPAFLARFRRRYAFLLGLARLSGPFPQAVCFFAGACPVGAVCVFAVEFCADH